MMLCDWSGQVRSSRTDFAGNVSEFHDCLKVVTKVYFKEWRLHYLQKKHVTQVCLQSNLHFEKSIVWILVLLRLCSSPLFPLR